MKLNYRIKFIVSEPWDFSSSDGDNLFYCTILKTRKNEHVNMYLAKANSKFSVGNVLVNYLVLEHRNKDSNDFNIYCIKDANIDKFCTLALDQMDLKFIIIGTLP